MLTLLGARRFGPLFVTQFLGAFNDNLYKTAMLFLITYGLMRSEPQAAAALVTLAGGVFILPFLLFSSLSGEIADKVDKAAVVRWVKLAEIAIMAVGAFALSHDSVPLLMLVLFAMGTHSTFFGPIKYAILPQHLPDRELLAGTGLVEAGTYIAILTGQIAGGLLGRDAAWAVVAVAVAGYLSGRLVPPAPSAAPDTRVRRNLFAGSWRLVEHLRSDRRIWLTVLAVSWFWTLGAVLTTQFVPLVKDRLHGTESVATVFLAIFSVGVAAGSVGINRLLRGEVSARFAPVAAAAVSLFVADVLLAVALFRPPAAEMGWQDFLASDGAGHILFALAGLAVSAGMFVVPLYAMLQTECVPAERARTIAGNNIVNAAFMVAGALIAAAMISAGVSVAGVIAATGIVNLAMIPATRPLKLPRLAAG